MTEFDRGYAAAAMEALLATRGTPTAHRRVAIALAYGALYHCDRTVTGDSDPAELAAIAAAYDTCPLPV